MIAENIVDQVQFYDVRVKQTIAVGDKLLHERVLPDNVKRSISGTAVYNLNDVGDDNKWVMYVNSVDTTSGGTTGTTAQTTTQTTQQQTSEAFGDVPPH